MVDSMIESTPRKGEDRRRLNSAVGSSSEIDSGRELVLGSG